MSRFTPRTPEARTDPGTFAPAGNTSSFRRTGSQTEIPNPSSKHYMKRQQSTESTKENISEKIQKESEVNLEKQREPEHLPDQPDENSQSQQMSKTEASYKTKGDKSYYYWHDKVPNKLKIDPPPLLHKKQVDIPVTPRMPKKILNYSWMDDDKYVKIFVDLTKIGTKEQLDSLSEESVQVTFDTTSCELLVKNLNDLDHQLKISSLKKEIEIEKSSYRLRSSKIILKMQKKDPDYKWYDLCEKS